MNNVNRPRHRTLVLTGAAIAAFGLGFCVVAVALPDLLVRLYALAASGGTVPDAGASSRFGAALCGALMLGWGVMMVMLGRGSSLPRAAVASALAWFVADSTCSALTGFPWNAASNLLFLAPFLSMLPALASRPRSEPALG